MNTTPTPRTDAKEYYFVNHDDSAGESIKRVSDRQDVSWNDEFQGFSVPSKFARELETELAESQAMVQGLKQALDKAMAENLAMRDAFNATGMPATEE